eukprot:CAMPEP_0172737322 /NCGR_PEP_ID=MMETSP1074-20121228/117410_1 /TAXON_ID=2916 /ORGANISM="Ceratium fusus, Strain PA161109" /LENGTH=346 /DNA_ID=CAMNT_0013566699 /DNA_START=11 /DNA_END=1051 /DNA_ORIENTATION=+
MFWYLTSFGTLLLNKYILGTLHIQPNTLAVVQMVSTAIYGALKTLNDKGGLEAVARKKLGDEEDQREFPNGEWQKSLAQMSIVGAMRFATVILGLVSLKYVAASFTETIKASAPFFTVIIAYLMLGETSSLMVFASLIPVAGGLVLVSYTELSFNIIGFGAAISTNIIECVQNVFSKRLLARDYTAVQLQFYTSLTALVLQAPMFLLSQEDSLFSQIKAAEPNATGMMHLANGSRATLSAVSVVGEEPVFNPWLPSLSHKYLALLWVDGVLYHLQSVAAYMVMSHLSPVTVSVVNTVKRALLIWISVLVFGNRVTPLAGLGTAICLSGALCYNFARQQLHTKQAAA